MEPGLILQEAERLLSEDRQDDYGDARESFERIASLWSVWTGKEIFPEDVAIMLALLKISRLKTSPDKLDSWVDGASYMALGGYVAGADNR